MTEVAVAPPDQHPNNTLEIDIRQKARLLSVSNGLDHKSLIIYTNQRETTGIRFKIRAAQQETANTATAQNNIKIGQLVI